VGFRLENDPKAFDVFVFGSVIERFGAEAGSGVIRIGSGVEKEFGDDGIVRDSRRAIETGLTCVRIIINHEVRVWVRTTFEEQAGHFFKLSRPQFVAFEEARETDVEKWLPFFRTAFLLRQFGSARE
jgi:hypothetical protein